jgi:hypothetical protein
LEHVLHSALFIAPYRCGCCDERYFRFRFSSSGVNKQRHHAV